MGTKDKGFAPYISDEFDVFCLDPRGLGQSSPRPPLPALRDRVRAQPFVEGRWPFEWHAEDWISDIRAAIEFVSNIDGEAEKILIIGHSMGGCMLGSAAFPLLERHVASLALISAPFPGGLSPLRRFGTDYLAPVVRGVGHLPAKLLGFSSDEDEDGGVFLSWMACNRRGAYLSRDGRVDHLHCIKSGEFARAAAQHGVNVLALTGAADPLFGPVPRCELFYHYLVSGEAAPTLLRSAAAAQDALTLRVVGGAAQQLPLSSFRVASKAAGFGHDFNHANVLTHRMARKHVWPVLKDFFRNTKQ